jgi:hypothetical protein
LEPRMEATARSPGRQTLLLFIDSRHGLHIFSISSDLRVIYLLKHSVVKSGIRCESHDLNIDHDSGNEVEWVLILCNAICFWTHCSRPGSPPIRRHIELKAKLSNQEHHAEPHFLRAPGEHFANW